MEKVKTLAYRKIVAAQIRFNEEKAAFAAKLADKSGASAWTDEGLKIVIGVVIAGIFLTAMVAIFKEEIVTAVKEGIQKFLKTT